MQLHLYCRFCGCTFIYRKTNICDSSVMSIFSSKSDNMRPSSKITKDKSNKEIVDDVGKEAKSAIDKILGDISKTSATKQIVLGASSGWVTGFLAMRVGKTAALALGSGIILLQIANEKGYIKINWDKVNRNIDKVTDKVEETISGEPSSWMNKAERFVDRKLDQVEGNLKKGQNKAKRWYSSLISEDDYKLKEVHIFFVSFLAGVAIGVGSS